MKKKILGSIIFLVLLVGVGYLYNAYISIYHTIQRVELETSNNQTDYLVKNNMTATKKTVYVALGDSLTAGVGVEDYHDSYPYRLAEKMSDTAKVDLRPEAVPGARSEDLIANLLTPTINAKPDIVTLLIGVNDVHGPVTIGEFRKNYEEILERLTRETKATVYLINIPFIGADSLIRAPYNYYFDYRTREFNEVIKELAKKYKLKYIDLYGPTREQFRKAGDHYAADTFHPSASGYAIWAQVIYDQFN